MTDKEQFIFDNASFVKEAKQTRAEFAGVILANYPVGEHTPLRTKADSLLIMFDQMLERIETETPPDEPTKGRPFPRIKF
jgi:hypothetical protein